MNRLVCQWNNLGKTRSDLVPLWDCAGNGDVTPFDALPGSPAVYLWLCDRDPSHPSFPARVNQITSQGTRCGLRHPGQTAQRARLSGAARGRMQRVLARQALPTAPGEPDVTSEVEEVGIEPPIDLAEAQATRLGTTALPLDLDLFGSA